MRGIPIGRGINLIGLIKILSLPLALNLVNEIRSSQERKKGIP